MSDLLPPVNDLGLLRLSTVAPQQVSWLFDRRIPKAKLSIVEGPAGFGKSTMMADLAARVSTGAPMPFEDPTTRYDPRGVLLLSAEDNVADTLRPRLEAAGADLERITTCTEIFPLIEHLEWLEAAINRTDAALVVIDPLVAFLGRSTTMGQDQSLRRLLNPLAKVAERTGAAIVLIRHLIKGGSASAGDRGFGSVGLGATVRSVLGVCVDPDDDERRILVPIKFNLTARPPSLEFRLIESSLAGVARVEWLRERELEAAPLARPPVSYRHRGHALDGACKFLRELLKDGPFPANRVLELAIAVEISKRTLERAKEMLNVQSKRTDFGRGGYFCWHLPEPPSPKGGIGEGGAPPGDEKGGAASDPSMAATLPSSHGDLCEEVEANPKTLQGVSHEAIDRQAADGALYKLEATQISSLHGGANPTTPQGVLKLSVESQMADGVLGERDDALIPASSVIDLSRPRTMRQKIVEVPSLNKPIQPSPGFEKKGLSNYKLDLLALCGFGCRYCSSNNGYYLRINREKFADLTEAQLGKRILPKDDPSLMLAWPDVIDRLRMQLESHRTDWGAGQTLMFSMLTDGFSPWLLEKGFTQEALSLLLEKTRFRIRVLTKSEVVGSPEWVKFFQGHRGRFIVGLSIGSLDDRWAQKVELGTSLPSARLAALANLQQAGVPTFGMLCPVFPDVMADGGLEQLIARIRPNLVEHLWAEPFNDRNNWEAVRGGYSPGSFGYTWLTDVYENRRRDLWSRYATDLYTQLLSIGTKEGWHSKLRYLLYEQQLTATDAYHYADLKGVLLQSKPGPDGLSQNPHIRAIQHQAFSASTIEPAG